MKPGLEGTTDNSPRFQPWVTSPLTTPSPEGTAENPLLSGALNPQQPVRRSLGEGAPPLSLAPPVSQRDSSTQPRVASPRATLGPASHAPLTLKGYHPWAPEPHPALAAEEEPFET
jgi:hypothetical protein